MARNPHIQEFMDSFPHEALTFDDVSLVTRYADFLPSETDLSSRFSRNITVNIPFVSAAMDTVTETRMAIAMAMLGGIGVVHKNISAEEQAAVVRTVKHHLNGLIQNPVTFRARQSLADVERIRAEKGYSFSGFPILDDNDRLVGILTAADIKFAPDPNAPIADIMTSQVITAPPDTTLEDAYHIMQKHKIGKLPLVNEGKLVGLYSYTDVSTLIHNVRPMYNRDDRYRLRVAAAVGPGDYDRVAVLRRNEVDCLVIDTAHGHTRGVIEMTSWIKKHHPDVDVIAGNIATAEAAVALHKAGADAVKVGIGPGSICTTRVIAGVGIPQITAIYECARALRGAIPVVADGGIRNSGDVAKALAAGADTVMMGSVLAGTEESPGEKILFQGRQYVLYRGMGSLSAMQTRLGSRQRYAQADIPEEELVPQGIEGMVPYSGTVEKVMNQFSGGLRAAMGYCGCRNIDELHSFARFVRITHAGVVEAHPHDVKITKEAPNYRT